MEASMSGLTGGAPGNNTIWMQLQIDGSAVSGAFAEAVQDNGGFSVNRIYRFSGLSAGSHTFTIIAKMGNSNNNANVDTTANVPMEGAELVIIVG
jgi:hypothetical protein